MLILHMITGNRAGRRAQTMLRVWWSWPGLGLFWLLLLLSGALLVGGNFWRDLLSGPRFSHMPQFARAGAYAVPVGLDEADADAHAAAFGDFNADSFVDLFVLSANRSTCRLFLWDRAAWQFRELEAARLHRPGISAVLPADFDGDGRLDVLLQGRAHPAEPLYAWLVPGRLHSFDEGAARLLPSSLSPLAVLDADGDLRPDLFGVPAPPAGAAAGALPSAAFWLSSANWSLSAAPVMQPLSPHHAHSFVDLVCRMCAVRCALCDVAVPCVMSCACGCALCHELCVWVRAALTSACRTGTAGRTWWRWCVRARWAGAARRCWLRCGSTAPTTSPWRSRSRCRR